MPERRIVTYLRELVVPAASVIAILIGVFWLLMILKGI